MIYSVPIVYILSTVRRINVSYPVLEVANELISLASEKGARDLTPMKLQKLVYYAHGWSLGVLDEPLIDEQVEAWRFGPVVPTLYDYAKHYGNGPIDGPLVCFDVQETPSPHGVQRHLVSVVPKLSENDAENVRPLLDWVWSNYGHLSGIQLSNLTHEPGTPWHQVCESHGDNIPKNTDINPALIQKWFKSESEQLTGANG